MRHSIDNGVSQSDLVTDCERSMRDCIATARWMISNANWHFDHLDVDPELKADLWSRFNATERRLMKDKEGKEWS